MAVISHPLYSYGLVPCDAALSQNETKLKECHFDVTDEIRMELNHRWYWTVFNKSTSDVLLKHGKDAAVYYPKGTTRDKFSA